MINMDDSVLNYWGFRENPFSNKIATHLYYKNNQYEQAIRKILYSINESTTDIIEISGEVGTGKTFTSIYISHIISSQGYTTFYCDANPESYSRYMKQLVRAVTDQKPKDYEDALGLFDSLIDRIRSMDDEKAQLVLFFDEAHEYSDVLLERIRQLLNKNVTSEKKVISIILVGQPELRERIRKNKPFFTRIKVRQYLNYLSLEDIQPYIHFKFHATSDELFKTNPFDGLYADLYRVSQGMPRFLNAVCEALLAMAAEENQRIISREMLTRFEQSPEFKGYLEDIGALSCEEYNAEEKDNRVEESEHAQ